MKMLEIENLQGRNTEAGNNIAGFGTKPVWEMKDVVIRYGKVYTQEEFDALGELDKMIARTPDARIVDVFKVTFKNTSEGAILTASAATDLQFFVPAEWEDINNAPFVDYDGRYNDTRKAGLGGTLGEVLQHGNGVAVMTAPLQKLAAAISDETYKKNEEN